MNIQIEQQIDLTDISKYPKTIRRLYEGYTDDLWIAAGTSLYRYHISEKYIEIVSDSIGTITGMAQTKDGDLWCATEEKGLACVNRQNILTKYPFPQNYVVSLLPIVFYGWRLIKESFSPSAPRMKKFGTTIQHVE